MKQPPATTGGLGRKFPGELHEPADALAFRRPRRHVKPMTRPLLALAFVATLGLLAFALPAQAAPSACLSGSTDCVEVAPAPYCLASYNHDPADDYLYFGCRYPNETCVAADHDPDTNRNLQFGCVQALRPGCTVGVAVVTEHQEGYNCYP